LLIARTEYPELDVEHYLQRLDDMAVAVLSRVQNFQALDDVLRALNAYLFIELGFTGNADDYYDPRNSFLNVVLERKLGIPITMAIVYMEIGHRLGLPLAGVSFPGHFLVKLCAASSDTVLDPFSGGSVLSESLLEKRLDKMRSKGSTACRDLPSVLLPASNRSILERMLRNLKGIYLKRGELDKCLRTVEYLLSIRKDDPYEIRDRGLLFEQLECHAAAAKDYRRYLACVVNADDSQMIRERLAAATRRAATIH